MTTIRVKPEELEIVAKHVPDAEDACRRARTSLSWTLPSLAMEIPSIGSAAIRELTDELIHWLDRYEEKLNEAEELLYRTDAAIRQADQTLADNIKEFGLELLGWYDLQRVFGEYDPVTGERLSFGDRLFAGGMLLLSVIPPAKGAGIAGKAGIKGAKAAGTAADVSKLVPQMKYVLRYDKMMSVFQAAYLQVVKAPITKTLQYFKKQWNDLLASVSSVQWQPAFAGIGPVSRAGIQETAEEVTSFVRFSMSQVEGEVGKRTDDALYAYKGTENVKVYDVVPYRPNNSPLENHHGVLDVWTKHNIPNYVSRGADTPTIALTKEQHDATKRVYREWLYEKTGKKVGGKVDWKSVSPQEVQQLTERMFDAANVPQSARRDYYRAFHQYIYRE
ncbi:pre-toxin TG domain-containing protein [Saccharococcus caldoxylosilyticus]|uniref:pre-toxin TG domain-containing protein n=1 Tax=Saccharococcus caldoxylosilyticus TaxID=81408 RepID=UPI0002DE9C35|nr:pre-toxin TG domain-containing protein [Parageobacillus caldoxylosilyticus]